MQISIYYFDTWLPFCSLQVSYLWVLRKMFEMEAIVTSIFLRLFSGAFLFEPSFLAVKHPNNTHFFLLILQYRCKLNQNLSFLLTMHAKSEPVLAPNYLLYEGSKALCLLLLVGWFVWNHSRVFWIHRQKY